jgi:hypothetical protein
VKQRTLAVGEAAASMANTDISGAPSPEHRHSSLDPVEELSFQPSKVQSQKEDEPERPKVKLGDLLANKAPEPDPETNTLLEENDAEHLLLAREKDEPSHIGYVAEEEDLGSGSDGPAENEEDQESEVPEDSDMGSNGASGEDLGSGYDGPAENEEDQGEAGSEDSAEEEFALALPRGIPRIKLSGNNCR